MSEFLVAGLDADANTGLPSRYKRPATLPAPHGLLHRQQLPRAFVDIGERPELLAAAAAHDYFFAHGSLPVAASGAGVAVVA